MKKLALPGLAVLALVIVCPHDDYTFELTPHGNAIERKLTFYRADGTNPWSSQLPGAGFYLEQFRGDDDLATQAARRLAAGDQLTDLALGWRPAEFRHEPRYRDVRRLTRAAFSKGRRRNRG